MTHMTDLGLNLYTSGYTFEEILFFKWYGEHPNTKDLHLITRELALQFQNASQSEESMELLQAYYHHDSDPVKFIHSPVFCFALQEDLGVQDTTSTLKDVIKMIAQISVYVVALIRKCEFEDILPKRGVTFSHNLLLLIRGSSPEIYETRALDAVLLAYINRDLLVSGEQHLEHELPSRIAGDIARYQIEAVHMANPDTESYANEGFDKLRYPHIDGLDDVLFELGTVTNDHTLSNLLKSIELMQAKRGLYPTVHYYCSGILIKLGVPRELFASIVIISRTASQLVQKTPFNPTLVHD
jgi:citrate synthase